MLMSFEDVGGGCFKTRPPFTSDTKRIVEVTHSQIYASWMMQLRISESNCSVGIELPMQINCWGIQHFSKPLLQWEQARFQDG